MYAREKLRENISYIMISAEPDRQIYMDLIEEIVKRAQGVFLWVILVVRSLCNGIMNGDTLLLLQKRLYSLPLDLKNFFEFILESIEPIYQVHMACAILVALDASRPLKIIHYSFLDEEDHDPQYCWQLPFQPYSYEELKLKVSQTRKRLNGRYKGLLESSKLDENKTCDNSVEFLHRTLRDYLMRPDVTATLLSNAPKHFDSFAKLSQLFLGEMKFVSNACRHETFASIINFAQKTSQRSGNHLEEFAMYDHVELVWQQLYPNKHSSNLVPFMFRNAIHLGRYDYVLHRLQSQTFSDDINFVLQHLLCGVKLSYVSFTDALSWVVHTYPVPHVHRPVEHLPENSIPSSEIVKLVLEKGGNPNAIVDDNGSIWRNFTQWFLIHARSEVVEDNCHEIFRLLLERGADINSTQDIWTEYMLRSDIGHIEDEEVARGTIRLVKTLLGHGLDCNAILEDASVSLTYLRGTSVWSAYLQTMAGLPILSGAKNRKEMLVCFLSHGADLTQIYQDGTVGKCWFGHILYHLRHAYSFSDSDYTLDFDVMLKHGLDPSENVFGQTLWEHVLDAIWIDSGN
jgi:hypothetical protein